MNTKVSPVKDPGLRRIRWIVIGVICIPVLLALAAFGIWRIGLRREINARIAAIQADGYPVNWEDLTTWKTNVADEENAALVYRRAMVQVHSEAMPRELVQDFVPRGKRLSDEARTILEAAVQTNHLALELAYQATTLSRSSYRVDYSNGPTTLLPHLSGLKNNIAFLLEYDALLQADSGFPDEAAKAVTAVIMAAKSLDAEPCLMSQLFAQSMFVIARSTLERVLNRVALADEFLSQISLRFAKEDATNRIILGLIGDRAMNAELIRLAQYDVRRMMEIVNTGGAEEERTELPRRDPGFFWKALGFFERDRAFYLRAMEKHLAAARMSPPQSLSQTNELEPLKPKASRRLYFFSALLLPPDYLFRDADHRARMRTAIATIAVERWRLVHADSLPDSLDVLVPTFLPAVPLDPYDGRPLRFKKLERGYVVYSIGHNREDDGGKEQPSRKIKLSPEQRNRFDITFTVER